MKTSTLLAFATCVVPTLASTLAWSDSTVAIPRLGSVTMPHLREQSTLAPIRLRLGAGVSGHSLSPSIAPSRIPGVTGYRATALPELILQLSRALGTGTRGVAWDATLGLGLASAERKLESSSGLLALDAHGSRQRMYVMTARLGIESWLGGRTTDRGPWAAAPGIYFALLPTWAQTTHSSLGDAQSAVGLALEAGAHVEASLGSSWLDGFIRRPGLLIGPFYRAGRAGPAQFEDLSARALFRMEVL